MGIPTGPQQGRRPAGGGLPIPGGQKAAQQPPRKSSRPTGLPQPSQQGAPRGANSARQQPTTPRREQQAPPAQRRQVPARSTTNYEEQEGLPSFETPADFEDPFSTQLQKQDPFSEGLEQYAKEKDSSKLFEDDPFENIDSTSDDFEEEAVEEQPEATTAQTQQRTREQKPAAQTRRMTGNNKAPRKTRKDSEFSESFMDKEKLELKPFGNKPKKKAKVGDFDARKNLEGQRKIYRGVFIAAIVAVVGFGAYQTFWPAPSMTEAQVQEIAALTVGETGFPTAKGEGFALSFIDSLLEVGTGEVEAAKRDAALSYFYGVGAEDSAFDEAITAVGEVKQNIVYGPVITDSSPLTANAASYEVSLLLNSSPAAAKKDDAAKAAAMKDQLRWATFNVNVFYDDKRDSFAIAPNSPSLIPSPAVVAPSTVPAGDALGEDLDEYPESVNATVMGFLEGYRVSTKTNYDKVLQYIGTEADESLRNGLGGQYQFNTPQEPMESIEMQVFDAAGDASELKVELTVEWKIETSKESSIVLPSHYVMTLSAKADSSSDYSVTKFAPYYWTEPTLEDGDIATEE